jgi:hypothetical protein
MSGIENTFAMNVKATHNSVIRRFTLDSISLSLLQAKLRTTFDVSLDAVMDLLYTDDAGDLVTFSSDQELQQAAGLSKGLLRVNLATRVPAGNPWEERRKHWIHKMEARLGKLRGPCGDRVPRCHARKMVALNERKGCHKREMFVEKRARKCSKLQTVSEPVTFSPERRKLWIQRMEAHGVKMRGPCGDRVPRCHARKMAALKEQHKGCLKEQMWSEKCFRRCSKLQKAPELEAFGPERHCSRRNLHKESKEVPDHAPLVDEALVKKFTEMGFSVGPRRIGRILFRCKGDVDSAAAFFAHKAAKRAQKHCRAPSS